MGRPADDPYRTLGILRGADPDEVRAAHRRLAKRFHPDGSMGDEQRFLAVQEAYQLLSDPLRRREWDRRHTPGPVRPMSAPPAAAAAPRDRRRTARAARPQPAPGARTTTWSAEQVPWWQDFSPRARRDDGTAASTSRPGARDRERRGRPLGTSDGEATPAGMDFDVFNRSSGAAWSMAARRHFRRGDEELPSRGAWRYRGSQVVTGAEARKVAAEEAAEQTAREAATPEAATPEATVNETDARHTDAWTGDGQASQPPPRPEERSTR
ncbi:MAG TPA: J domain-containing protein [Candidatus Deferrimicrobium sp.]|nr:J domain-containing protein [Candidatus Deferrimicrobium sp.]